MRGRGFDCAGQKVTCRVDSLRLRLAKLISTDDSGVRLLGAVNPEIIEAPQVVPLEASGCVSGARGEFRGDLARERVPPARQLCL